MRQYVIYSMNAQLKSTAMAMADTLFMNAWIIGGPSRLGAQYEISRQNFDSPHSLSISFRFYINGNALLVAAVRCSESAFASGGIRSNNEFQCDATARWT